MKTRGKYRLGTWSFKIMVKREATALGFISPRPALFTMGRVRHCTEDVYYLSTFWNQPHTNYTISQSFETNLIQIRYHLSTFGDQPHTNYTISPPFETNQIQIRYYLSTFWDQPDTNQKFLLKELSCSRGGGQPCPNGGEHLILIGKLLLPWWTLALPVPNLMLFSIRGKDDYIESPPSRLAGVGGSFDPREWGGQEVQVLLRHPLELLSGVTVFNGDLDQCFAGLVALIALVHAAADAGLALLHQRFRATALPNHLSLLASCSSSRPLPITRHYTSATTLKKCYQAV